MPSSTCYSARVCCSLLASVFAASRGSGQTLVMGDVGTATPAPLAARSTVTFGVPLLEGRAFRLEAGADGAGWLGGTSAGTGYATGTVRISWEADSGQRRATLRVGRGGLWDGAGPHAFLFTALGGAVTWGRVGIELSLTETRLGSVERWVSDTSSAAPIDTLGATPPGPTAVRELVAGGVWRGARAQLNWSGGPIDARLTGGTERKQGEARATGWLRADATAWLTPQVGIVAGVGSRSPPLLEARPPTGGVTLGLRAAFGRARGVDRAGAAPTPAGPAFEIRSVAGDLRALRVRVPHAQRVELTADFLDWQVVSLVPADGGSWGAQLSIGPGSHRVNIRIDGGPWVVPPGLPAVADDFTGAAGLLRVD